MTMKSGAKDKATPVGDEFIKQLVRTGFEEGRLHGLEEAAKIAEEFVVCSVVAQAIRAKIAK